MRLSMTLMGGVCAAALLAGCATTTLTPAGNLAEQRAAGAYTPSSAESFKAAKVERTLRGKPLSLNGYHVTYNDDFNKMSVTDEDGSGPWYAPVHDSFGAATFIAPRPNQGPVYTKDGKLVIEMSKEENGWVSTNVQSVNGDGHGFAQQYGYFEMRAQLAPQPGGWGGIWLHSHPALTGPDMPQAELDIIEAYGGETAGYHAALHLWPAANPLKGDITKEISQPAYNKVPGMFDGYHTFGALVTPKTIIYYYDRKELARVPTPPEFKTPLYVLMDMTVLPKLYGYAKGKIAMNVDYVRVWQKNDMYATPDKN